ncbi:phosphoribosyltransferase family protein [Variovorax humicola]|uniref:Phosphoribosyltransferase family protein n=1 Tax=Variovorax humicola TaxID=1769758 RepID=A0ABU8WB12_9BURK
MLERRRKQYTPDRAPIDAADRTVIVVDDGLATGATMVAALHAVRARKHLDAALRRAGRIRSQPRTGTTTGR